MDFVAEVMLSAEEASRIELNELATETCSKIINMKHGIKAALEDSYVHLHPLVKNNESLITEASTLTDSVDALQKRLQDQMKPEVQNLNSDLKNLKESLAEATLTIHLCNKLLAIVKNFDCAKNEMDHVQLAQAAEYLFAAENLLKEECEDLEYLDIYQGMASHLVTWKDQLLTDTLKHWHQNMEWEILQVEGQTKKVTLKVCAKKIQTTELFRALHFISAAEKEIKTFSDNLLTEMLKPVVLFRTTIEVIEKGEYAILKLSIDLKSKKSQYATAMKHLSQIFEFLNTYLSLEVSKNETFLRSVGSLICSEFLETFIEECLSNTIPCRKEELPKYEETLQEIKDFETQLKGLGFITDDSIFESYYSNLDELFANKTMERYLVSARDLMKKDLHEMKQVGVPPVEEEDESPDKKLGLPEISINILQFPLCKISQTAEDLLTLVRKILAEVTKRDDKLAVNLYFTTRDIFTMYLDIVPMHHRKILESIPQQAALLHNNLMYLAHHMMTLDLEFRHSYPPILQGYVTTFVDFVYLMRTKAVTILNEQVDKQNGQIMLIIKNSGLSSLSNQEYSPESVEKSLRQCIRQLFLLQSVWQCVLPINIYSRIMAHLVKNFIEELVLRVISTKDILAKTASELVRVFTVVMEEVPTVFPEPKEVHKLVKNWSKFVELIHVLGGSLLEIAERWADGKGPLALEFSPEQVRHLVRALFQVSERRAAVLAKIV